MFQCVEQKLDIYELLSFCLGYLKRKIFLLIRILINEKNLNPKPELLTELASEQLYAEEYCKKLQKTRLKFSQKQNEKYPSNNHFSLFQRFVYRIKQLIRNYLPHASISHELFVYLKKIETYSFKQNNQYQDYLVYILQQNPVNISKDIIQQVKEIKDTESQKINKGFKPSNFCIQPKKYPYSDNFDLYQTNNWVKTNNQKQCIQMNQNQQQRKVNQNQLRPIDVFNNSISPILTCMNCDISYVRAIYFNYQKQKQNAKTNNRAQSPCLNSNKSIPQMEIEMLDSNKYINLSIKSFDRQYAKYQNKILKTNSTPKKVNPRCQTAYPPKKQPNYTLLSHHRQKSAHKQTFNDSNKKTSNISALSSQQQKYHLYKQIQNKRHNILKMKSISVSVHKGNLELCSQNKEANKKLSLTFANFKKGVNYNSRKNTSNNLKKKYDIFMNTYLEGTIADHARFDRNKTMMIDQGNRKSDWKFKTIEIKQRVYKNKEQQVKNIYIKGAQTLSLKENAKEVSKQHKKTFIKEVNQKKQEQNTQIQTIHFQETQKLKIIKTPDQLEITIKNYMRGINLNQRNYQNGNYRSKKLFQTINPQLCIKTIKK